MILGKTLSGSLVATVLGPRNPLVHCPSSPFLSSNSNPNSAFTVESMVRSGRIGDIRLSSEPWLLMYFFKSLS